MQAQLDLSQLVEAVLAAILAFLVEVFEEFLRSLLGMPPES
jgi:hypothetical protein